MEQKKNVAVEVSGLDSRFECPICLLCLKDPVLTSCGHRFCSSCIQSWLKKKNACCPVDNTPLHGKDLFPDNFTKREIFNQKTQCSVCDEEFSLSMIDDHLASHDGTSQDKCPFFDVGCEIEVLPGTLKIHLEEMIQQHLKLLHNRVRPVDEKYEETKFWEAGKEAEKANSLLRNLYERVIILEQKAQESECQIRRYKKDILTMEKKMEEMAHRHCFGEYLWRVDNFRERIQGMSEKNNCFFSPGFYTSPAGYKICARMNVASHNPNYLTLVVHLMQSENDIALPWPFSGSISLAVVHPSVPDWSLLDTMAAEPELEAFSRPQREINPKAFGFVEYTTISSLLENDAFLDNGVLTIKILVQSKFTSPQ